MVLGGGLEPPCLAAYAPQTYVSAISPPEQGARAGAALNLIRNAGKQERRNPIRPLRGLSAVADRLDATPFCSPRQRIKPSIVRRCDLSIAIFVPRQDLLTDPHPPYIGLGVSLWMVARCINMNAAYLPLIAVLDQAERDRGFCVLELRFRAVEPLDALAGGREVGNAGLTLHGSG